MFPFVLLTALLPLSQEEAELQPGVPLAVEITADDPVLAGWGPSRRFAYTPDFDGRVFAFVLCDAFDPYLRIEGEDGVLLAEEDDGLLDSTDLLFLEVKAGAPLTVVAGGSTPDDAGTLALHLHEAPETEATRAAAAGTTAVIQEIRRLATAGDRDAARDLAARTVDEFLAIEGAERSHLMAHSLGRVGYESAMLGDLPTGLRSWEHRLRHDARVLPAHHPALQSSRVNVANLTTDVQRSAELLRQVVAAFDATLEPDDERILMARSNLGTALNTLRDHEGARELYAAVLEASRERGPADFYLQTSLLNLGVALRDLGRVQEALALWEELLAIQSGTLPDDDLDLQMTRANIAGAMKDLGDFAGALAYEEKVLAVRSRLLPDDNPYLQSARMNLAATLGELGRHEEALQLVEKALAVRVQTLPGGHPERLSARLNFAIALYQSGEFQRALEQMAQVEGGMTASLGEDHPDLLFVRGDLAQILRACGEHARAADLERAALRAAREHLPPDHLEYHLARQRVAWGYARAGDDERAAREAIALASDLRATLERAATTRSPRQAEELAASLGYAVSTVLSIATGGGVAESSPALLVEAFALVETARAIGLAGAEAQRTALADPELGELRDEYRRATERWFELLARGAGSGGELADARQARERLQQELAAKVAADPGGTPAESIHPDAVQETLRPGEAAVAYWRYTKRAPGGTTESLLAFAIPAEGYRALVDLGPMALIAQSVDDWREAVRAWTGPTGEAYIRAKGDELRRLVLDPVLKELADVNRLVVVPDDVLHLIAFDALPADAESPRLVGDEYGIALRTGLAELLRHPAPVAGADKLVAAGAIDYDPVEEGEDDAEREDAARVAVAEGGAPARLVRAGEWADGFTPLPGTRPEILAIAELFRANRGGDVELLTGEDVTRTKLAELAGDAAYLHLATHGYFTPDAIPSVLDPRPIDARTGVGRFLERSEHARGVAPMLLCGLALSGANGESDRYGRLAGVVTAEEVAGWDLAGCELAVLSACDTASGELRRGGQGIASLHRALHVAGARSVITSLWQVEDEGARRLMTEFYRRLWEEGLPPDRALWGAKTALREERFPARVWAGWVLSGG